MPAISKVFIPAQDDAIAQAILGEEKRQAEGLELIASENYVSPAVLEALGTVFTNKYSEGYPGNRYYGGQTYTDVVESLAIERAKQLFGAEHVNVQPHSGAPANIAAYFAILEPGDTVLGMDLAHGGHLTHGHPVTYIAKLFKQFSSVIGFVIIPHACMISANDKMAASEILSAQGGEYGLSRS